MPIGVEFCSALYENRTKVHGTFTIGPEEHTAPVLFVAVVPANVEKWQKNSQMTIDNIANLQKNAIRMR